MISVKIYTRPSALRHVLWSTSNDRKNSKKIFGEPAENRV